MQSSIETAGASPLPAIQEDLFAGFDVGGTKIHITNSLGPDVARYNTSDFPNMEAVLARYFAETDARPANLVVGMAGPRDDETGQVKLTNTDWPALDPVEASERFGIRIETVNDMVATTAGVLLETGVDLKTLKPGTPTKTGTKLVVALSTGIGAAAAVWDGHSNRYVILAGEAGHMGFHPRDEEEQRYLDFLHKKYPHASTELAFSGKEGIENLYDHFSQPHEAQGLSRAVKRAREAEQPIGGVLIRFATNGVGAEKKTAEAILKRMGAIVGSAIRNLALAYKATGGVYLTGGVAEALGEYFAERTDLSDRFVGHGAVHDKLLEKVPISLVMNTHVAAIGALALAKDL